MITKSRQIFIQFYDCLKNAYRKHNFLLRAPRWYVPISFFLEGQWCTHRAKVWGKVTRIFENSAVQGRHGLCTGTDLWQVQKLSQALDFFFFYSNLRRLLLGRKVMTNLDSIFKSRDFTLSTKVCLVKAMVFPVVVYGCESWTIKKAEHWRTDAFKLWCWRKLLSVTWTARRSTQSILEEISP